MQIGAPDGAPFAVPGMLVACGRWGPGSGGTTAAPAKGPDVTVPTRRLLTAIAAAGALALTGCSGGDAIPNEPAEEAGPGEPGGDGGGEQQQPAPGNPGLPDPTDDLTEPTPGT